MSRSGDRMSSSDVGRAGGLVERDIEQAITALKKGAYLLKYGRRGKPKFCPFRLANDESGLIWFSGKEEKQLKLSQVSRIISGQRTPIFQRYPRPEKEYQSFSLIYNDRSLDLICKDKEEAEVWFSGLKALISRGHHRKWKTESRSDGISSGATSPRIYTRRSSPLHAPFGSSNSFPKDAADQLRLRSPFVSPPKNGSDKPLSDMVLYAVPPKGFFPSDTTTRSSLPLSSGGSDGLHSQMKGTGVDAFRVSLSSAVSSSSQGSGHDDGDAMGDVFIWGEGTGDSIMGGGPHSAGSSFGPKTDALLPKALESAVVLDVQNIACGGRHAALVTKQGEIFSWGEELGGRLGHGVDADVLHPKLIDVLSNTNIELVACGENHSCAVTLSGDLYTWGNGHFGLLGHGNEVSHWVPKRVNGPLEGIHVSSISCGPWHTAVVTSSGQLFTFGDGTFGVLGHGDRLSVSKPREVESLKGLRTVRAACGVWHTAAVVEIMVGSSSSSNCSSGKLFTWGDGDKGRLGHGDKETKLVPTCVAALVDPTFCQVACGHSLTVALTTSGHVYVMGSPVYGQLGNPQADGKLPARVEGKLARSFVEEIACGAYHVAVLTSRTEVYTWGKGANGRLGHGDTDDRSSPTLVEALKDKQVKSVACGTNFTAAICLHKWISGVDQSMCSGCRLPFNFKRKRHNCYNCGLVFCHSCSGKKSLRASMAPNPNKPYRVCDNCFDKLRKAINPDKSSQSSVSRRGSMNRVINENTDKDDKLDAGSRPNLARFSSIEPLKQGESRTSKRNKKLEFNSSRVSPVPSGSSQWGSSLNISKSFNPVFGSSKKFFSASVPGSRIVSRATSPISRRTSPPRSTTPTPTLGGLTSPKIVLDDIKMTHDGLNQEVTKLRVQVENLTCKAQLQELELERTTKQLKEAITVAGEETAKCKAAKEVIKSLTAQLKEMADRLPVGSTRNIKSPTLTSLCPPSISQDATIASFDRPNEQDHESNEPNSLLLSNGSSTATYRSMGHSRQGLAEATPRSGNKTKENESQSVNEWVEQDEPGVYITLTSLPGGLKDLKRVRFSRKRFSEKQAEQWWAENRARVYEQYNVRMADKSSVGVGKTAEPQSTTTARRLRPHLAPPTPSSVHDTRCRSSSVPHSPPSPSVCHLPSATKPSAPEQEMLLKTTTMWPPINACCSGVPPLMLWSPASLAIRVMRWLLELRWSMMVAL
ncbi:Regulator of chromosome condensation (RCC1) family with FYVE zinc finger domain [Striga hermonthica]|uniref:Regulator of chromosome condensation (RCC1) family with FYVE zinc finger domain n=1 Tax=Striga hermonthica TaxID=68872 RepID=A0A9N7MIM1_STRHE|nr:Regulator of chromosome condensation (RCC1) family with FYVE zinc finger domain [Striga hermonthica]